MQRVLVTGAGGYIGTVLIPRLLRAGYAVRAVDRFFFGRALLPVHPALEPLELDVRELTPTQFRGVDAVIDLAAISNDPAGEEFRDVTWAVNHAARVRCAALAKASGVARYLLPSSCSVYGFQPPGVVCREESATNPLTTYAQANAAAEQGVLPLADRDFVAVVLRQATAFGLSPRMRFDLAVNGMTWGAWSTGRLPLLRDGSQSRPMAHVADLARAMQFMLEVDADSVNGRVFNVGGNAHNTRIGELGSSIASSLPRHAVIEWYGDPDQRSYHVDFSRLAALGLTQWRSPLDGAREVFDALESGATVHEARTNTLEWYRALRRERLDILESPSATSHPIPPG